MWDSQTVALVAHNLPPGRDGYSIMLRELFGEVPEDKLAMVGIGGGPWGSRVRLPLPVPRQPSRRSESAVMAAVMAATRYLGPSVLRRLFPNVRRIVATLDPTMIIAERWARATGADLWVYGIDLHASAFWGAGPFLQKTLARWRRQTLGRASRCFGLSPRMNEWMRADGAPAEVELLPPLINIDAAGPVPLPTGRRSLLFVGWLYTAQGQALAWLQKAVTEIAPDIELRLLTHMAPADVAAMGLDPARWTIKSVPPEQVLQEVASSTCMIAALDPVAQNRAPLQVIWPTKLREYLSVGRPVLVIAPPDYGIVDIATQGGWGLVAHDEASTRAAVETLARSSNEDLRGRSEAAFQFALRYMNNRTAGAAFRRDVLAP
ncbi:MAG: hypothetical protein QOI66_1386 [Myxococcales bacterium]|jgi:hypothetical protein|nr:hypothetical protein [Myxococcales bacterium]